MVKYYCDKCGKEIKEIKSGPNKGRSNSVSVDIWGPINYGQAHLCDTCGKEAIKLLSDGNYIHMAKVVRAKNTKKAEG